MYIKGLLFGVLAMVALSVLGRNLNAQTYSYDDEDGNHVFTNIAPVGPVANLKISGELPAPPPAPPKTQYESYDSIIEKCANDFELPAALIKSIIATESGFNHRAVSPKGARGLMQLMPATAARLGVTDSFDPEQNIRGGVRHFRSLMNIFNNDIKLSLAAYNAGENLVQRLGRIPEIRETRDYVRTVTRLYDSSATVAQTQGSESQPQLHRYIDEDGVLHLTDFPPME